MAHPRGFISTSWLLLLATSLLGLAFGAAVGTFWVRSDSDKLVQPKASGVGGLQELQRLMRPPQLKEGIALLKTTPPWSLEPIGREPGPAAKPPPPPAQRWVLVGRVLGPDGQGVVLYQPESGVSKRFKLRETLPDGRSLVSIEETTLVLRAATGKKTERVEVGAGFVVESTPATTTTTAINP